MSIRFIVILIHLTAQPRDTTTMAGNSDAPSEETIERLREHEGDLRDLANSDLPVSWVGQELLDTLEK
jgi:hypothetical protein